MGRGLFGISILNRVKVIFFGDIADDVSDDISGDLVPRVMQ